VVVTLWLLADNPQIDGSTISIQRWQSDSALLERVTMSCQPTDTDAWMPACQMMLAGSAHDVLQYTDNLQDEVTPLVLTLTDDIDFAAVAWPEEGVVITANVTFVSPLGSSIVISWGLRTVLFEVHKNGTSAFLAIRGCVLLDLPLRCVHPAHEIWKRAGSKAVRHPEQRFVFRLFSYLPLDHPRRALGILSTAMWPVYR
jgi:hypothetical protein